MPSGCLEGSFTCGVTGQTARVCCHDFCSVMEPRSIDHNPEPSHRNIDSSHVDTPSKSANHDRRSHEATPGHFDSDQAHFQVSSCAVGG